jgi:hypothetical protein
MAISYNVYANDGLGGAVNYATPISTTTGLTYSAGTLAIPSDNTFAVRSFDSGSGIEEANTDARVRIVIDASGNDVTTQPNPVIGLRATPTAGGTCWVAWGYDSAGQGGAPAQFNVTLTPGSTPSLASPVATILFSPGVSGYGCSLSGLASNTLYTVAVQAEGSSSRLSGIARTVEINYQVHPLSNVDTLVAIPSA